jgi:hypothetical protein
MVLRLGGSLGEGGFAQRIPCAEYSIRRDELRDEWPQAGIMLQSDTHLDNGALMLISFSAET